MKLSYSCMPNMGNIIQSHNKTILGSQNDTAPNTRTCNCRNKSSCPLDGKCLTPSIIYEATLSTSDEKHEYMGSTEFPFKTRYGNHKKSFTHNRYRSDTELSKKVWDMKDANKSYNISWRVLQQARTYTGGGGTCDLCVTEKLHILKNPNSLNKRTELVSKCRHARKYLLCKVKDT